jgi:hypothetical protein
MKTGKLSIIISSQICITNVVDIRDAQVGLRYITGLYAFLDTLTVRMAISLVDTPEHQSVMTKTIPSCVLVLETLETNTVSNHFSHAKCCVS